MSNRHKTLEERCGDNPVSCCDETTARVPDTDVSRRALFKGAALVASVIPAARPTPSEAQGKETKLAYCSQLLCAVPYEVARSAGYFNNHGLDLSPASTRAANAPLQAPLVEPVDLTPTR